MSTFTGGILSGSTNGRGIKVAANSSPGTTVHTVGSGTSGFDEVWLWVTNSDSVARGLTIEWGGATAPDDDVCNVLSIPPNSGPTLVVPGLRLNNGLVIKAFGSAANVLVITGYYNRATTP